MKLLQAIGISLGLALLVSLSACKDDPKGLRQSQNPPQPVPGPSNTGFTTNPPEDNSDTDTPQDNPSNTDTAPDGS